MHVARNAKALATLAAANGIFGITGSMFIFLELANHVHVPGTLPSILHLHNRKPTFSALWSVYVAVQQLMLRSSNIADHLGSPALPVRRLSGNSAMNSIRADAALIMREPPSQSQ
jgi:hypothetical protein